MSFDQTHPESVMPPATGEINGWLVIDENGDCVAGPFADLLDAARQAAVWRGGMLRWADTVTTELVYGEPAEECCNTRGYIPTFEGDMIPCPDCTNGWVLTDPQGVETSTAVAV